MSCAANLRRPHGAPKSARRARLGGMELTGRIAVERQLDAYAERLEPGQLDFEDFELFESVRGLMDESNPGRRKLAAAAEELREERELELPRELVDDDA